MDALGRLVSLVAPHDDPEVLDDAWRLAEEFLGVVWPREFWEFTQRYGGGEWGDNLELHGPRELFLLAPGETVRGPERADVPWPLWPEPDGALHVGSGYASGVELYLLRDAAGRGRLGVIHGDRCQVVEEDLIEWLTGWVSGQYTLVGGAPEPWPADGDRRPTMTARAPRFRAAKDRPAALNRRSSAHPRLLLRATLTTSDIPLDRQLEVLAQAVVDRNIPRAQDWTRAQFSQPLMRYQHAPWQRSTFLLQFDRHRGYQCWYDGALVSPGQARIGCFYGTDEHDHAAETLEGLASALNCAVENWEII